MEIQIKPTKGYELPNGQIVPTRNELKSFYLNELRHTTALDLKETEFTRDIEHKLITYYDKIVSIHDDFKIKKGKRDAMEAGSSQD